MAVASVHIAAAANIHMHYHTVRGKRKKIVAVTVMFLEARRMKYSGRVLIADVRFQDLSGHYKNFTRMSSIALESIIRWENLIMKMDTHRKPVFSVQEKSALTLRFFVDTHRTHVPFIHCVTSSCNVI